MKSDVLKQANILVNWLDAQNKNVEDINVSMIVKTEDHQYVINIMKDGSIIKTDDSIHEGIAYQNAVECIKSFQERKQKDSLPNESMFVLTFDLAELMHEIKGLHPTAESIQDIFNLPVKSIENDKVNMIYTADVVESPATIATYYLRTFNVRPIDIKKIK